MTQVALISAMRNEGLFALEWIAYHQTVGFGPIVICSNHCDDGSPALFDALAAAGEIVHLKVAVPPDTPPQHICTAAAKDWLTRHGPDWAAHLDADEFLNIHIGAGTVSELIANAGPCEAIAVSWRSFGANGHITWPGATLPHFTRCEPGTDFGHTGVKCLFQHRLFERIFAHFPNGPLQPDARLHAADGTALRPAPLTAHEPRVKAWPLRSAMKPLVASVNHYAIRSPDVFALRYIRGRGEGQGRNKYRVGSRWYRLADRNDAEDRSILRHWPETEARLARLRALPDVARTEAACADWVAAQMKDPVAP